MNRINLLATGTESLVCEIGIIEGTRIAMSADTTTSVFPVSVKAATFPNAFLIGEDFRIHNTVVNMRVKSFHALIGASVTGIVSFESVLESFPELNQFFPVGQTAFCWRLWDSQTGVPVRVVCEQRGIGPLTPDTVPSMEYFKFDVTSDITIRVYVLEGIEFCSTCGKPTVAASPTGFVNFTNRQGREEPLCHVCASKYFPDEQRCGYCGKLHAHLTGGGGRFILVERDENDPNKYTETERCRFCHSMDGLAPIDYPVKGYARKEDVEEVGDDNGDTVLVLKGYRDAAMTCPICRRQSVSLLRGGTCCEQISDLEGRGGHRIFVDYSYKPTPAFHHHNEVKIEPDIGEVYMGMELEMSLQNDSRHLVRSLASEVSAMDVAYCKTDSSIIGDGFEIVTHPRTLSGWKNWDEFLNFVDRMRHDSIGVEGANGIHIHVGRTAFGERGSTARLHHMDPFVMFWNRLSEKYPRTYCELVGRPPTTYCIPDQSLGRAMANGVRTPEDIHYDRYRAVNVAPYHTIELRMFSTTFDLNKLLSYLELVHASVMMTNPEVDGFIPQEVLQSGKFLTKAMRFIANSGEYPHLLNRIRENQIGGRASCV